MRGPSQASARLHAPVGAVRDILNRATADVDAARRAHARGAASEVAVHRAEQILLLARLAADTGARRGELAALQLGDLDGDVLTISRATSCQVVGPTKTGRIRRLTLGATAADLWRDSVTGWNARLANEPHMIVGDEAPAAFGPLLFSHRADHAPG